nr:MAG TPA: hypothetical protein [Caudoviricetes sp.]
MFGSLQDSRILLSASCIVVMQFTSFRHWTL